MVGVKPMKPRQLLPLPLLMVLLLLSPRATAPTGGAGGRSAGGAGAIVRDPVAAAAAAAAVKDPVAAAAAAVGGVLDPSSPPSSSACSGATADCLKDRAAPLTDASVTITSAPSMDVEWVMAKLQQLTASVIDRCKSWAWAARASAAARMAGMSTEVQWLVVGSMLVLAANFLGMSVG